MANEAARMRGQNGFDFQGPQVRGPEHAMHINQINQQSGDNWAQQFSNPAQQGPRHFNPQLGNRWINQMNSRQNMPMQMSNQWKQQQLNSQRSAQWKQQINQKQAPNGQNWASEAKTLQQTNQKSQENNSDAIREATEELVNVMKSDEKMRNSTFFSEMSKVANGDSVVTDDAINQLREPTSVANLDANITDMKDVFAEAYERQLAGEEVDLEAVFNQALGNSAQYNQDNLEGAWGNAERVASTYELAADNKYIEQGDEDSLFDLGMELFNKGELKEAIMAFQAVVEKDMGNSEAWRMLGVVHQELDEDRKAIICLENAKEQDPYNLNALLELGVSYVNELDQKKALANLKSWVQNNPKFSGIKVDDIYGDDSSDLMHDVAMLMTKVEEFAPLDPDVQVVMGVLFNVTRDYDDATRAFKKALNSRPDDYSLWNKLGATLANSSKSEEALPVYTRAIELKPKYARGWLNFGISHSNLGDYTKAIRAYLRALELNPDAVHIWSYLRICLTVTDGHDDLMPAIANRDIEAFRKVFDF